MVKFVSEVLGPRMPCIVEVSSLGSLQISVKFVESVGSAACYRALSIICLSYALIKSLSLSY